MTITSINALKVKSIQRLLEPLYHRAQPFVAGLEHLDAARPALYVCNHTSPFALDVLILYMAMQQRAGISLTALAHRSAFRIPAVGRQLEELGIYEGTRANCRRLMAEGKHILVFPGGSRELLKTKDKKYRLDWNTRIGFVRMAIEHGYRIVPVAKIGGEDHYDIRFDSGDFLASPLGGVLRKLNIVEIPPVVTGWAATPLPRPERYYIRFMPAIDTTALVGQEEDEAVCLELRSEVKEAIEAAIDELKAVRDKDPQRNALQRLKSLGSHWWRGDYV